MFFIFLAIIFFLILLFSIIIGAIIIYHFKRFGIKDDPNVEKFLRIFKIGWGVIVFFNFISLLLVIL